jgi:hypothetical protein
MPTAPGLDHEEVTGVLVVGAQRTGSTWLRTLVETNLEADAEVRRVHAPEFDPPENRFLVIHRDPWAWLVRFYEFQRHPVHGFVDRLWNRVLHPPVDRYRAFRWWNAYLMLYELHEEILPEEHTAWIAYRDLLPDPRPRLADALDEAKVPRQDELEGYEGYTKDFSSPLAKLFSPERFGSDSFDPTYYTEKRYLDDYRDSQLRDLYEMAEKRGVAERFQRLGYDLAADVPDAE